MTKREAIAIFISVLISTIVGMCFWFLGRPSINQDTMYNAITAATSIIVAITSATLALAITSADNIFRLRSYIEKISEKSEAHRKSIDKALAQLEDSLHSLQASTRDLQSTSIAEVRAVIGKMKPSVRKTNQVILDDFERTISLSQTGIRIKGCDWSLRAYQSVWEHLVTEQTRLSKEGKEPLIARITHSNDIGVWAAHDDITESLYLLQKDFVQHGGIVYRILSKQMDVDRKSYEEIKDRMENVGIQVYIVERDQGTPEFDFLFVDDDTKALGGDIIVKWLTSADGHKLAAAEIEDTAFDDVRRQWRLVCEVVANQNPGISTFDLIPEHRRIV